MKKDLIFIDTETGGIDPNIHSLLQVGYVIENAQGEVTKYETDISSPFYVVTPQALAINKLDLAKLQSDGTPEELAMKTMMNRVKMQCNDKPIVVGHNVSFDVNFLKVALANSYINFEDIFSYRMIDTMSILRALNIAGVIPETACSSKGAFEYFGIENKQAHTALADGIATRELFYKLVNLLEKAGNVYAV